MARSKKVLLIDDDAAFVEANQSVLEHGGYQVVIAYSGEEGFIRAQQERPDVVVLDAMMVTTSEGVNVARELRNSEQTCRIPLIMVTAINSAMPFKFGPDETWLPVNVFLEKPVSPEWLLAEVERVLQPGLSSTPV